MSLFHQIWERPQESDLEARPRGDATAQKLGAKTERERGYISALAVFYGDPASTTLHAAGDGVFGRDGEALRSSIRRT